MALPSSGEISMSMIAAEIGISAAGLSLNDSRVRQLAGKPSGAISFSDLRGKAWLLPPRVGNVSGPLMLGGYLYLNHNTCHPSTVSNLGGAASSVTTRIVSGTSYAELRSQNGASFRLCNKNNRYTDEYATLRVTMSNSSGSSTKDFPVRCEQTFSGG